MRLCLILLLPTFFKEYGVAIGTPSDPEIIRTRLSSSPTLSYHGVVQDTTIVQWFFIDEMGRIERILQYLNGNLNYDDERDAMYSFSPETYDLTIANVSPLSAERYTCEFRDPTSTSSDYLIQLFYAVETVSLTSTGDSTTEGAQRVLRCIVPAVFPEGSVMFTLMKGNEILTHSSDAQYSESTIVPGAKKATFTHAINLMRTTTNFSCKAVYLEPEGGERIATHYIPVEYCDRLDISGDTGQIKDEGQPGMIRCNTTCFPAPDIKLMKGNVVIAQEQSSTSLTASPIIERQDYEKKFYCTIVGKPDLSSDEKYYNNIRFPPSVISFTEFPQENLRHGQVTTLTCTTDSLNPVADLSSIVWKRGTTVVLTDDDFDDSNSNIEDGDFGGKTISSSYLYTASKEHNEKHLYCLPKWNEHELSGVVISQQLRISFPPTMITMTVSPASSVNQNQYVTIKCLTDSLNPSSSFTMRWYRGDNSGSLSAEVNESSSEINDAEQFGGKIATSTYRFQALKQYDQKYITCVPVFTNEDTSHLKESVKLDIQHPPVVAVSLCGRGVSESRNEETQCIIQCNTDGGNPMNFQYQWQKQDKFSNQFHDVSPEETARSFEISSLSYSDAGKYRCKVSNTGGMAEAEGTLTVQYAPIGIDLDTLSDDTVSYFAALGSRSTLSLTVHGYPGVSFDWTSPNVRASDRTDEGLGNDSFRTSYVIDNVQSSSYGNYSVRATSGTNLGLSRIFTIMLKQRGKPGPPQNLSKDAVSSFNLKISFIPGLDGGYDQEINVMIRQVGESDFESLRKIPLTQDEHDIRQEEFEVDGNRIRTSETYEIQLSADNEHDEGSPSFSSILVVTIPAMVSVSSSGLILNIGDDSVATLTWSTIRGNFTMVIIKQCMDIDCLEFDVTANRDNRIRLHTANGTDFSLLIYQDSYLVVEEAFQGENEKKSPSQGPSSVGLLTGIIVAIIVVIALIGVVIGFIMYRRKTAKSPKDELFVNDTAFSNAVAEQSDPLQEDVAAQYSVVQKKKGKKAAQAAAASQPTEEELKEMYAQPQKRKKNVGGLRPTDEELQGMYAQPNKKSNGKAAKGPKPQVQPKPGTSATGDMYNNQSAAAMLNDNPYANTDELARINMEQGAYANVDFAPKAPAPTADQDKQGGLIYADLSFAQEAAKAQPAQDPDYIHGADERVEYAVVDFTARAPKPPDSESDDDEDVNKK